MTDDAPFDADVTRRGVLGAMAVGSVGWLGAGRATDWDGGAPDVAGLDPTLVEANPAAGFNFPYYLYAPPDPADAPLLVEPVNSGAASDDFQQDLDAAERTVRGGPARRIADAVGMALLVPVFANPRSGEFSDRFVQSLDTETMHIDSGKFERIDRQLLRMVDDARERLAGQDVEVPAEFAMNGFSASGNFVNNFAALHPERVTTVTAGAINGMATLPRAEAKGYTLNYQIGIADVEELIGEPFDADAWRTVDQLNYMGAEERSPQDDTLPYRDVWSAEQAAIARAVYGDDMQEDRMTYSEALYEAEGAAARFEVYDGVGHSYSPDIVDDVVAFHARHNGLTRVGFGDRPAIGDAAVEVDLALAPPDADGAPDGDRFDVRVFADGTDVTASPITVPAGAATSRDLALDWPIEAGQTATVAVLPTGERARDAAVATGSVDVVSRARLVDPPTAGDGPVTVSYELTEAFDSAAVVSVVPPGDAKYWQRRVRVASVRPGDRGTASVQLTETDGTSLALGEPVQVWMIPQGNQIPSRTIATDVASIPGVRFAEDPTGGDEGVSLRVALPDDATEGTVRLAIDGGDPVTLGTVTEDGVVTRRFDLPEGAALRPLEGGAELTASLVTAGADAPLDERTVTVARRNVASVAFAAEPADLDDEVTVSYALDERYEPGDFVALRLYSDRGSSWGIWLDRVAPGADTTGTFAVSADETGIPFADADQLRLALVDDDDPYARDPLATDAATVGGAGGRAAFRPRVLDPDDGAAVAADEPLSVRVETTNVGDASGEARVGLTASDWRTTETVSVSPGDGSVVSAQVPASELTAGERTAIVAVVDGHSDRVVVTGGDGTDERTAARTTTEDQSSDPAETSARGTASDVPDGPPSDGMTAAGDADGPTDGGGASGETPGFGVTGALATLAGAWYALRGRGDGHDERVDGPD